MDQLRLGKYNFKLIAKETGFLYLDTGAMYRATTLAFLRNNISVDDASAIDELLENLVISFKNTEDGQLVFFKRGRCRLVRFVILVSDTKCIGSFSD